MTRLVHYDRIRDVTPEAPAHGADVPGPHSPGDARRPGARCECEIYGALRAALPNEWRVFESVGWVLRRRADGASQGEADFLLAHPEHGLVVLAVKGGIIEYDAATASWTSQSLTGVVHPIKDPIEQAHRNRRAIEAKLSEAPGWPGGGVPFAHAAALPDCQIPAGAVSAHAPRKVLLGFGDLGRLEAWVLGAVGFWRKQERTVPLGESGMQVVCRVFANSFQLRMPLGRAMAEDARQMVTLTERQFSVLGGLARNRRTLITGGAGTGKTLLALEKAKRLARDQGFRTLLTCFNLPLAAYLRASSEGLPNLTVMNFHELCAATAQSAGLVVRDLTAPDLPNTYFRHELPALLVDAMVQSPERFEAVVIDEGQDFSPDDRAALEHVLVDRAESVLYVFQDETQAIYREASPWPEQGMSLYTLTENRRNTRKIHEVVSRLHRGVRTEPLGAEGREPEFLLATSIREQARELSRVLHRLIRDESVAPGAIAVLVSSRRAVPELVQDGRIGAFEVTFAPGDPRDRVLVESVTRFKGLERDVVILARLDPVEYCEYGPMLHVGASRARQHLVVIGDQEVLSRFEATVADEKALQPPHTPIAPPEQDIR